MQLETDIVFKTHSSWPKASAYRAAVGETRTGHGDRENSTAAAPPAGGDAGEFFEIGRTPE